MNFEKLQPYFTYTKSQRAGLFALFALILILQAFYYWADFRPLPENSKEQQRWLAVQSTIDSMGEAARNTKPKTYPFNPNFITDFKGYKLGLSVAEIDRMLAFRKTGRYVNSAEEFQQVTQVSDSLLRVLSPYFKFPDWVKDKKPKDFENFSTKPEKKVKIDINLATKEDLKKIYGIGDGLSERILQQKEKLGGFVSMEQMADVWGLSPEVIEKLNQSFKVELVPPVRKVKINSASLKELAQFPYFRYALAKNIVTYRSMDGPISGSEDLLKISGFPVEKVKIIALYLEF